MTRILKIALPIGHLQESTEELLHKSGIHLSFPDRQYNSAFKGIDFFLVKPRNIPKMVARGMVDAGIVGLDMVRDERARVKLVLDLKTMPVHLVVAGKPYKKKRKIPLVATEYTNIARSYFRKRGIKVKLIKTYGATEGFVPDFADMIVDHVQTGRSLKENGLAVLGMIMNSTTHLVAFKELSKSKQKALASFCRKLRLGMDKMHLDYPEFLSEEKIRDSMVPV